MPMPRHRLVFALPISTILVIGGLLASAVPVAAVASECDALSGNLVTNCGFETGDFTGWTQGGDTSFTGVDATNVHSGVAAEFAGPIGSLGSLSQAVTVQAGSAYAIRYYVSAGSTSTADAHFDAQLTNGGAPATLAGSAIDNPGDLPYTAFNFTFVAATTSATLTFNYLNIPDFWFLDDVSITELAPPTVAKSFSPTSIALNGTSTLTFDVTNPNAVGTLTGVAFTDTLPAGLVIATPNNITGFCTGGSFGAASGPSGGNTTSFNGTLVPSSHCTYSIDVTATTVGVKGNTVEVTSGNAGTGNTAAAALTVSAESDFAITKSHSGTFRVGQNGVYTITVSNLGPGASAGKVTVKDAMPNGMLVQSISAPGWACSLLLNTVTCSRSDSLAAGSAYPAILVTVRPTILTQRLSINTARVTADFDINPANNVAVDATVTSP